MRKIIFILILSGLNISAEILNSKKSKFPPISPATEKSETQSAIEVPKNPESILDRTIQFSRPHNQKLLILTNYSNDSQEPHRGILYLPIETGNVLSAKEGKIVLIDYMDGYHNYIIIEHANGYFTVYGNLNMVYVEEGQSIKKGETLGVLLKEKGLYFQITQGKKTIDPNFLVKG
jgi:lipoprotein YgeR